MSELRLKAFLFHDLPVSLSFLISWLSEITLTQDISKFHFRVVNVFADQGTPRNPLLLCSIKMEVIQHWKVSCMDDVVVNN